MAKKASLGQVGQAKKEKVAEELSKIIGSNATKPKEGGSTAISLRLPKILLEELDLFLENECHGLGRSAFIKQAIVEKMKSMQ